MFIGRERELRFLEDCYNSNRAELIILYGRRRVGKTETLHHFSQNKEHLYYTCTEIPDIQQLQSFSREILRTGIPASKYVREFQNWDDALGSIAELPYNGKKLLIIDEFPYMCRKNPSIPSILQKLWDTKLKHENVMLILCGSAMSFIEKEILSEKNPLYGRATGVYKMTAMDFFDASKFFPDYSDEDKITAYAVLGGIPHYLAQFDSKASLAENIKKRILTKGCALYSETEFLLKEELRETSYYNLLIQTIAMGSTSLNEIVSKTQMESTKVSSYLRNLIELGIVKREFPFTEKTKKTTAHSRGLYKLTDNFFGFWYAFGFSNTNELESGRAEEVYRYVVEPALPEYVSGAFESVCRQFIERIGNNGQFPFPVASAGRWWGKRRAKTTAVASLRNL